MFGIGGWLRRHLPVREVVFLIDARNQEAWCVAFTYFRWTQSAHKLMPFSLEAIGESVDAAREAGLRVTVVNA